MNFDNIADAKGKRAGSAQGGFTLIELMVVITIVSILAVIALPAYQDYVIRSKVSEGMVFVAEAKTSVSEKFYSSNVMATNNIEAGLPLASTYNAYDFVESLTVSSIPTPGTITVTFKIPGSTADGKQLVLVPSTSTGTIAWTCRPADPPDGISTMQVPANCRG